MSSSTRASWAFLALSCVGSLSSTPALALDDAPVNEDLSPTITVTGQQVKTEVSGEKATAPLIDTPQTITVISDQVIRKQNLLTLRDVLATVPGITFGAGEGGGGYGDSINLRGYSANNDLTLDGVRDSAQYSRTDPFNTQQIEVYNGANSVYNGSGSVGGTINLVSKTPQPHDLTIIEGGIGTDDYYRAAVDSNLRVSPFIAVRLNAVYHRNDVPGRDVERNRRWGVAPSITLGIDSPTSLTLAYVHQRDNNTPVYGIPWFRNELNDGPLPGTDDSDYYGIVNLDRQLITLDRLTATFRHDTGTGLSLTNLTRYQRVHQDSQTSAPQGTFCLAGTGRQPVTAVPGGTIGAACPAGLASGFWNPSGPRGLVRDTLNHLFYNQTTARWEAGDKSGLHNVLVGGVSLTREDYRIESASLPRTAAGAAVTLPQLPILAPDTIYTGPINYTVTARAKGTSGNIAGFLFDTLAITPQIELNAGLRYEKYHAQFQAVPLASYPPGTTPLTTLQLAPQVNDETLFSYRLGAVFKPSENSSLYIAYGNAKTPSSATVRLGCGTLSAPGAADPCAVAPETARNYEIGGKLGLAGNKVLLTAALFRNERSNYRVPSNDPSLPSATQVLDGRARVDGLALGVTGNPTPEWTIFANYTYLKSKVIQSISDFSLSLGALDPQAGDELVQTPKHSGSLFTSYKLPFGLDVGYGVTYQGSFALNQRALLNRNQFRSDDYFVHRAFLSYGFQGVTVQLNVQNLFDKHYFTGIRNNVNATTGIAGGGWATPGEGRSARLSLFYSF